MPHSTAVESYSFQQYGLASGQSAFLQAQPHQTLQQHGLQPHSQVVPVTAVETHPALRQSQHLLRRQQIPHHQASYGAGPSTTPAAATYHQDYSQGRKRSRGDREDLHLDIQGLSALQDVGDSSATEVSIELTPHGHHAQPQTQLYQTTSQQQTLTGQTQQHHHHRLPNQPAPPKMRRMGVYGDPTSPSIQHGPPSVVGQEGMPPPAPRPRGPKLKFTPEDDQLLVDLKEKKNLTWKQIADFFPGRSSGTLQVRYCTKLKAKTTVWTDDMVLKLRNAMREYDNDKWRIISTKVGSGFSPAACKEKAAEIAAIDAAGTESTDPDTSGEIGVDETGGYEQPVSVQHPVSGSTDPGSAY